MRWFYSGSSTKSLAELDRLVNEVILAEDFDQAHLKDFRALKENHRLDSYQGDTADIRSSFSASDGWKETSVKIRIPADGVKHVSEDVAPEFDVPGLFYRRPLEVIKAAFRESTAEQFHLTPFETFYQPSDDVAAEKTYGEVYNSSAMLEEHEKIRSQPREGNCTLETVVAAVMLWSDSTHLASFGTASLWPIYMFLGNQSKYARAKSTSFAAHHLAYIPKARLADSLHDFYRCTFQKTVTSEILSYCRHELMQAIWLLLLDDDFMHAYEFGVVIECVDGVRRRVFPRLFTYSADYPEKTLLASIKFLANCPCPRCLIPKANIGGLGSRADRHCREKKMRQDGNIIWSTVRRVRDWLYVKGTNITSVFVKQMLMPESLVPIVNSFSTRFARFGFNFYSMFVPDLLHEFELGVWKATFIHLIRVLY
ncbi:hypothetical protein P692DRAFT_20760998, partial [Suillus brevipes Sb2]